MDVRTVMCRNEDCGLFEQEHDRDMTVNVEDSMEWAEWVCPGCGEENWYEGNRQYEAQYDTMAEARGEK